MGPMGWFIRRQGNHRCLILRLDNITRYQDIIPAMVSRWHDSFSKCCQWMTPKFQDIFTIHTYMIMWTSLTKMKCNISMAQEFSNTFFIMEICPIVSVVSSGQNEPKEGKKKNLGPTYNVGLLNDDVMTWKCLPHYQPFVRGTHHWLCMSGTVYHTQHWNYR